jgi:hypothetical protein
VSKGIRYTTEKNYQLHGTVLPEKLTDPQLVKNCPVFYG